MGSEQVELVLDTWKKLGRSARQVSEKFYERLLEENPSLRLSFRFGSSEASEKLTYMLSFAVVNQRRPEETLLPAARQLGRLNGTLGVRGEHYDLALGPLLWALQQALGAEWTSEAEAAWTGFLRLVLDALKEGAAAVSPVAPSQAA
jgi:hemoglobin-like flavoprotein